MLFKLLHYVKTHEAGIDLLLAFIVFIRHELIKIGLYDLCIEYRIICVAYSGIDLVEYPCSVGIGIRSVSSHKRLTCNSFYNMKLLCIKVCSS